VEQAQVEVDLLGAHEGNIAVLQTFAAVTVEIVCAPRDGVVLVRELDDIGAVGQPHTAIDIIVETGKRELPIMQGRAMQAPE